VGSRVGLKTRSASWITHWRVTGTQHAREAVRRGEEPLGSSEEMATLAGGVTWRAPRPWLCLQWTGQAWVKGGAGRG
jgi:hypothetical protein